MMTPFLRNVALVVLVIILLATIIVFSKLPSWLQSMQKNKPTAQINATTTQQIATSTGVQPTLLPLATSSDTDPNFSPGKAATQKVRDKTTAFQSQVGTSVLMMPPTHDFYFIFNVPETFEESDSLENS